MLERFELVILVIFPGASNVKRIGIHLDVAFK